MLLIKLEKLRNFMYEVCCKVGIVIFQSFSKIFLLYFLSAAARFIIFAAYVLFFF